MPVKSVLLVSDFACINGGQAKVAIDSARLLADAGINVTFFAAVGPADPLLNHPGITVELLDQKDILSEPSRLKAMARGLWNSAAHERLAATIARFDPKTTVLHCHGYAKALSPSIGPLLTDGPLPSVYTMHEYFLACPNGGFYDYKQNQICTRKALGISCLTSDCDVRHATHKVWRVARQAVTWGPGRMPRRMKDIIYISKTQRKAMAPYLPEEAHLHHVPNPIARSEAPPVKATGNDVFLFIGRLNPEKGGLMFAKAARMVGVRAVFVGDGVEADAIREANPEAEILGWKSPAEVQNWLGRARALVFPSLWYEGQPLTPLEALARGVPVICGVWSAAVECVTDGQTGILYDTPQVEHLAKAITKVRDLQDFDPASVGEDLTPERHLDRLKEVYKGVMFRQNSSLRSEVI